jgi:phosphoribosylglycinamide formyltransferase-1
VLISGRGSNLRAILEAEREGRLHAHVRVVVSNNPDAGGLAAARDASVETLVMPHRAHATREPYDRALVSELRQRDVRFVCLAGFMRLLGPTFCDAFPNAILNIHPSLLPAFPGLDAQKQALEHGVKITGCTVHLVDEFLDAGPIVLQAAVPVLAEDTVDSLSARILKEEHQIYSQAIRIMLGGNFRIAGRRVITAATQS